MNMVAWYSMIHGALVSPVDFFGADDSRNPYIPCSDTQPRAIPVKDADDKVIGFAGYGIRGEDLPDTGEVYALYVLSDYYGKGVGLQLMNAALEQLKEYPRVCLWTLKDNKRAIRFYQKCGFVADGSEKINDRIKAREIRMIRTMG